MKPAKTNDLDDTKVPSGGPRNPEGRRPRFAVRSSRLVDGDRGVSGDVFSRGKVPFWHKGDRLLGGTCMGPAAKAVWTFLTQERP